MRLPTTLILLLTAALLWACSGVETQPEDTGAFAAGNYTYYKWRSEPLKNSARSTDPLYVMDPVLRREIDTELQAKGYVLDPERAQFSVDYLFAVGMRMGEKGSEASNLSTYPGVIPNRNIDQASVDNAYALGGVKETNNIAIQFNDVARKEEVWRVIITKIVENANTVDDKRLASTVRSAIRQGLRPLPKAGG
jgi:hypothetical protein